jgi:hypothetical protein
MGAIQGCRGRHVADDRGCCVTSNEEERIGNNGLMKRWLWVIPLLLAVIVYARAPFGEPIWDDITLFERQLPRFETIADVLNPSANIQTTLSHAYFRPAIFFSLMIDRGIYGVGPEIYGFHISNLIYHVFTTLFVWLLARRMLFGRVNYEIGALAAAAVFAVHPIHVETVTWISGRSDLLATFFLLPSILFALRWRDYGATWSLFMAALLYLCALVSKEVALAGLILAPATLALAPQRLAGAPHGDGYPPRTNGLIMWTGVGIAYSGLTAFYFLLRDSAGIAAEAIVDANTLLGLLRAAGYYLIKVIVPWPHSGFVSWNMLPGLVGATSLVVIALGLTALGIRSWSNRRDGSLLYIMLWFGAALGPSLALVISPAARTPVAERYLYLPSVAMALLIGIAVAGLPAGRKIRQAIVVVVALLAVYGAGTFQRSLVWQSNLEFWTDAVEKGRGHPAPLNQLGQIYYEKGDDETALKHYREALKNLGDAESSSVEINDLYARTYNQIGIIYRDQRNLREAERYFSKSLETARYLPSPYYNLGTIYSLRLSSILSIPDISKTERDAMFDRAVDAFRLALRLDPGYPMARWMLSGTLMGYGEILEEDGEIDRAIEKYRQCLEQIERMMEENPALRFDAAFQAQRSQVLSSLDHLNNREH